MRSVSDSDLLQSRETRGSPPDSRRSEPSVPDPVLTVLGVAAERRCSKAHVYKAIKGGVPNVPGLPTIHMGRRALIRRSTLEQWKRDCER